MLDRHTHITQIVHDNFQPDQFELVNNSHKHQGHGGDDGSGQSHFALTLVTSEFNGMSKVKRHQLMYSLIKPLMDNGLHAIELHLHSPNELNRMREN